MILLSMKDTSAIITAIIILSLYLLLPKTGECGLLQEEIDRLIMLTVEKSIVHDYDSAIAAADRLIEMEPDNPAGYFFTAGVFNTMISDYEDERWSKDFHKYSRLAVDKAQRLIDSGDTDAWNYFYLGGSQGYISFQNMRTDRFFSALGHGMSAIKNLKKAVELDSTLYDAYLGIGNYKYWISRKTQFVEWVPFISDRREEGIADIYNAMWKGRYSGDSAASTLGWILLDEKKFDDALEIIAGQIEKYPESRFFMYIQAKALYGLERNKEAIEVYKRLLVSVRKAQFNNYFNEIGILWCLTLLNRRNGNYEKALQYAEEGLNLELSEEMREKKSDLLKKIRTVKINCEKRLNRN